MEWSVCKKVSIDCAKVLARFGIFRQSTVADRFQISDISDLSFEICRFEIPKGLAASGERFPEAICPLGLL